MSHVLTPPAFDRYELHRAHTPLGMIDWDLDFCVLSWNPAAERIFGYPASAAIGQHASFIVPVEARAQVTGVWNELIGQHGGQRSTNANVTADGTRIDCLWYNTSLVDASGQVIGASSIVHDITIQVRAEASVRQLTAELERRVADRTAQLAVANKELEAFAYSVSHDLRAPLRAIDGFSQAILEDYAEKLDDNGRDYLNRVRGATKRMSELIDDLLLLSRASRGDLRPTSVDLSDLTRRIIESLGARDANRTVAIVIQTGVIAHGDASLLRVVLENLLGNAWKYTSNTADARIEFGAIAREHEQAYFVRDNGAGYDPTYAAKLFQPFQRLHRPDEFEGHGIGLATVLRVVTRHGGRTWSEGIVGKGATFYFTLGTDRLGA